MKSDFDVVVVGAGPGGIASAAVAAEAGSRVCLVDDNRYPGGQIWRGLHPDVPSKNPHGREFAKWMERLRRTPCTTLTGTQIIDHLAPNILRFERESKTFDLTYRKLILATGARERFLPFPGWTLPGVTGAGGLQALVKSGLEVRDKRVVVAGTGPLLLAIAAGLKAAGANILAIYEQAPLAQLIGFGFTLMSHPGKIVEGLGYAKKLLDIPYRTGRWVTSAEGSMQLNRVTFTDGRRQWSHDCDYLACGFHLVPNLELPMLFRCEVANGYVTTSELQQTSVPNVSCVGELTGIGGLEKALLEGEIAGWFAAGHEDKARRLTGQLRAFRNFALRLDQAFKLRTELRNLCQPETIVCRCEDVAFCKLQVCRSWREAKLHTRCGMGSCQGRICGPQTEFLFQWRCSSVRPPIYPARLSSVAEMPKSGQSETEEVAQV
ncbi:MAG: NAD(P)/FAD-dependent oxidoreductase [Acidobacteria bacterium]|nr:NAD(P)/FAD-dependent oxidoreductase [Acidobacteriota bacterium]